MRFHYQRNITLVSVTLNGTNLRPLSPLHEDTINGKIQRRATLILLLRTVITGNINNIRNQFCVTYFRPVIAFLHRINPRPNRTINLRLLARRRTTVTFRTLTLLTNRLRFQQRARWNLRVVTGLVNSCVNLNGVTDDLRTLDRFLRRARVRVSLLINQTVGQPTNDYYGTTNQVSLTAGRRRNQIFVTAPNLLGRLTPNIFNITRCHPRGVNLLIVNHQYTADKLNGLKKELVNRLTTWLSRGLRKILPNWRASTSGRRRNRRARPFTTTGPRATTATDTLVTSIFSIVTASTFFPGRKMVL